MCRVASRVALTILGASLVAAPGVAQTEIDGPSNTTLVHPPFGHTMGIHRARPVHLRLFLGDRTRFDDPQGVAAVKFASDDDPERKGDDYQLTLFGVNSGRGEIIYNSSMQTLAVYGREGSGRDAFRAPRGIAATSDGRVYVADTGNDRVVRLRWDPVARALRWVGAWEAPSPYDVTADARGHVFVASRGADAVLRFADSTAGAGTNLLPESVIEGDRWPLPADARAPIAVVVADSLDPWYRPGEYRLYVIDEDGARLRAIGARGSVLAETVPPEEPGAAEGRFGFVTIDYYGNVYVTDRVAGRLYKYDPDLRPLTSFTGADDPKDAFDEPRGVAIWRRFGQVFVAEREGAHYFFVGTDFGPVDGPLTVRRESGAYALDLFMTEAALVSVTFTDASGDTLAVADAGAFGVGDRTVRWRADAWTRVPEEGWESAAHAVLVEARPTYSSRKRFSRIRRYALAWADP